MITKTQGFSKAPAGNTGLKCQRGGVVGGTPITLSSMASPSQNSGLTVCVDWLTVTLKPQNFATLVECCEFVLDFFDDVATYQPDRGMRRGKWWASTAKSVRGVIIGYNFPAGTDSPGEALISIPPKALKVAKSQRRIRGMAAGLANVWGARCSRIDVALDDFDKSISYEQVTEACEAGNFARANKFEPLPGVLLRDAKATSAERGWTIYLGSRQSDKFLRYYNKSVESGGEIDSYRWEVEFKGHRAQQVFEDYIKFDAFEFDELAPVALSNYIVGAIDFVDRTSGDRLERQEKLDWWEEFASRIGSGIRTLTRQCKAEISKKIAWIKKSVETSLALLQEAVGRAAFDSFFKACIQSGRKRYTKEHEALLAVYKTERNVIPQLLGVEDDLLFGFRENRQNWNIKTQS